jgi:hypothetical protein
MYEGDYVIRDVDAHIYGYPYVILLGRIPYTHYFRERYECLDYSIVKIVNTKTRDFYCAADDSDTEG